MIRTGLVAAAFVAALSFGRWGMAVPPLKTPEEVERESDVIAKVRVLAVVCTGDAVFPDTEARSPTYQAWLQVLKVRKGAVREGQTVLVGWQDIPKTVLGPWKVDYFSGEEVVTHLKWDATRRAYVTTWLNAKGKPTRPPDVRSLPARAGQISVAEQLGGKPKDRKKD